MCDTEDESRWVCVWKIYERRTRRRMGEEEWEELRGR